VPAQVQAFFNIAVVTEVGNGARTLFWADRWLNGHSIADLAPHFLAGIAKRIVNSRTVEEALTEHAWVLDFRGTMTEFFNLWDLLYGLQLQPEVEDSHIWRFSSSGQYSAKSA